jgi:hypothetical protein
MDATFMFIKNCNILNSQTLCHKRRDASPHKRVDCFALIGLQSIG